MSEKRKMATREETVKKSGKVAFRLLLLNHHVTVSRLKRKKSVLIFAAMDCLRTFKVNRWRIARDGMVG